MYITGIKVTTLFLGAFLATQAGATNTNVLFQEYGDQGVPVDIYDTEISDQLYNQITDALPESSSVTGAYLNPAYNPNLQLQDNADIFVTFIDEGAGYRNSLGYFSYVDDTFNGLTKSDIDLNSNNIISAYELQQINGVTLGTVFPNASKNKAGGLLEVGDTIQLGGNDFSFEAGTNIGFFLGANTWNGSSVRGYDNEYDNAFNNVNRNNYFYSVDFLNPEASSDSFYGYDSVADNSRHVAMLYAGPSAEDTIILGFEDLIRPFGDNDFNDAVFTLSGTPNAALASQSIHTAPVPEAGSSLLTLIMLGALWGGNRTRNKRRAAGGHTTRFLRTA